MLCCCAAVAIGYGRVSWNSFGMWKTCWESEGWCDQCSYAISLFRRNFFGNVWKWILPVWGTAIAHLGLLSFEISSQHMYAHFSAHNLRWRLYKALCQADPVCVESVLFCLPPNFKAQQYFVAKLFRIWAGAKVSVKRHHPWILALHSITSNCFRETYYKWELWA